MSETTTLVHYVCQFCENSFTEEETEWPEGLKTRWLLRGCKRCYIKGNKGERVRYNAWERSKADSVFADSKLKRGEVYTVSKAHQWIHGRNVELKETGNLTYPFQIFTPEKFEKPEKKEGKDVSKQ